jgi:hypothetical protein
METQLDLLVHTSSYARNILYSIGHWYDDILVELSLEQDKTDDKLHLGCNIVLY